MCYDHEFKKHSKFLELLSHLFKNEIEHKFLEHAEVIKMKNERSNKMHYKIKQS